MPILLFENGPDKGRKITLEDGVIYTVGRDPLCNVVVNDELVSPVHFRIKGVKGTFHIRDEKTESGTLVNDEKKAQTTLASGDKIQIGATILSLVATARKNGFTGKSIGGYRVLDRLGRGGMGTVYRALQESLNREVALKLLSPRLTRDPQFIDRFATEARAAAALSHPNVIQVYDVGSEGNLHYYSMEYARHGTVEEMIHKGDPIPVERCVAIIRDAAQGLFFAESKNLVHQDIKPQNLMVDQFGATKIADMGLARSLEDSEKVEDEIVGTPHFISPERIQRKEADIRSDIYSLGCTFYRILTGRTPFHGESAREILQKQLKEEPLPIRELRSDVPDKVCQVVARMMRKDPADRYPGIAALLADLENLSEKRGSRGKLVVAGILVAAAAAVAGFFIFGDRSKKSGPGEEPAGTSGVAPEEDEGKIEKLQDEYEKEVAELKARAELLQIDSSIPRDERIKLFDDIAARFPGTEAAGTASGEAAALRQEIADEAQALADRLDAIEAIRFSSDELVGGLIKEKRFFEALSHASRIGKAEELDTIAEVEAIRTERTGAVREAALQFSASVVSRADTLMKANDYDQARRLLEDAIPHLERPADFNDGPEHPSLQVHRKSINDALARLDAGRKKYRRSLLDSDLGKVLAWVDVNEERAEISRLLFSPPPPLPDLATAEYRSYLNAITSARTGGNDLLGRLCAALAGNQLRRNDIKHPTRGDSCTIVGMTKDGKSLRLDFSGATRLTVDFADFASASSLIDLIEDRFEMTGADLLTLSRVALLVEAARAAAGLAPLQQACRLYETSGTWNAAIQEVAAGAASPDTSFIQDMNRLLDKAASLEPALKAECDAYRNAAYREAAAMELFAGAMHAFTKKDQGALFRPALEKLEEFATDYTDTFFCRYATMLTGGSLREGGHLVEFVE